MLAEVWNSIDDTRPTWRCRGAILKARLIRNGLDYIALCQSANQFIQYLQMLHISWQILASKNIFVQTILKLGMGMGGGDHWISLPWRKDKISAYDGPLDKTCPLWVFKSAKHLKQHHSLYKLFHASHNHTTSCYCHRCRPLFSKLMSQQIWRFTLHSPAWVLLLMMFGFPTNNILISSHL